MYKRDEDIDRLSREAAEHYNAPGQPAWDALRQTLEKELPQEKEKKRRGFLFFFLLAIGLSVAGTALWYARMTNRTLITLQPATTNKAGQQPVAAEPSTVSSGEKHVSTNSILIIPKAIPNTRTTIPAPQRHLSAGAKDSKPGDEPTVMATPNVSTHIASLNNTLIPRAAGRSSTHAAIRNNPSGSVKRRSTQDVLTKVGGPISRLAGQNDIENNLLAGSAGKLKKSAGVKPSSSNSLGNNRNSADSVDNDIAAAPVTAPPIPGSLPIDPKPATVSDTATAAKPVTATATDSGNSKVAKTKATIIRQKAILFGLTGGVDMSTVKFTYGSNTGYNFGLSAGYQFSNRWSVLTGIIYTKKNYKLNGSDYHPPTHYWTQYVNLTTVDGYCRMWEVPVVARYIFNSASKNAFFASAGLSSYFMKKQQYNYYFKNNMGSAMVAPWSNDSSFNHFFTILDVSVGVQKSIGKHLDLLIEPYGKIPLGGVGFGKIRLSSFGVNLTVQYRKLLKH